MYLQYIASIGSVPSISLNDTYTLRYHIRDIELWLFFNSKIVICTTSYESHTFFHEFADLQQIKVGRTD
jgi:hypothetical protein